MGNQIQTFNALFKNVLIAIFLISIISCGKEQESPSILEKVTKLQRIVLVKNQYSRIETFTQNRTFGKARMLLVISGEVEAGIDDFTKSSINKKADSTILIKLPTPVIVNVKINHDSCQIWDVKGCFLMKGTKLANMENEAFKNAEIKIKKAALNNGIIMQAKENAKNTLEPFLGSIANRKVEIIFE